MNLTNQEFLSQEDQRLQGIKEYRKLWYLKNKEKKKAKSKDNYEKSKESRKLKSKDWYWTNRERKLYTSQKYYQDHKSFYKEKCRRYQASKKHRTPPWADKEKLKSIYLNCPEGYHVDHILPLHGRTVSGLHVPENLQYLPASENLRKGNRI